MKQYMVGAGLLAALVGVACGAAFTDVDSAGYWGKTGIQKLTETLDANFATLEAGTASIKLPANSVSNAQLSASCVTGDKISDGTITNADIAADAIEESHLKAVDSASDEDVLTYEATTGDFEWHSKAEIVRDSTAHLTEGYFDVVNTTQLVFIANSVTNVLDADITTE
jgi:hypothetical protein